MKPQLDNPFNTRPSALVLAALIGLGGMHSAQATEYFWASNSNSTWTTSGNWGTGGVAATNVSAAHRLNVNGTGASNGGSTYTSSQGTTVYGSSSVRGLGIGLTANGIFTITGGSFSTINSTKAGVDGCDALGNKSGVTGTLNVSGGTFIGSPSGTYLGFGSAGTGVLNVNSGTARVTSLIFNSIGTANLNTGGILEVNSVSRTGGSGTFNFNGGTLKARATTATFISGTNLAVKVKNPGAVIDSGAFNITIGSALTEESGSAGGGLEKLGAGALTLIGNNTYTGTTTIRLGTLQIGNGTTDGSIASSGSIANNAALAFNTASAQAYGNAISGPGSLTKSGEGILTLSGANTYEGAVAVNTGVLVFQKTQANSSSAAATGSVADGATLGLGVGGTGDYALADVTSLFNGTLTKFNNISATCNVGIDTTAGSFDYTESAPSVTRGLMKLGANTLTLSGTNAYVGPTTVTLGTLKYGANNVISTGGVTLAGGTLDMASFTDSVGAVTITSGTLKLTANQTATAQLTATGTLTLAGTLDLTGTPNTVGFYKIANGTSRSGTFSSLTGASDYSLVYSGTGVDAQHKGTTTVGTLGTLADTIITGGSTELTLDVQNSAPAGSADLSFTLGGTGVSGADSGGKTLAVSASPTTYSALNFTSSTLGPNTVTVSVTPSGSTDDTVQDRTASVTVIDHASPVGTPVTLALGNLHAGYVGTVESNSFTVANGNLGDIRPNLKGTAAAGANSVSISNFAGLAADGSTAPIKATLATGVAGGTVLDQNITYTFADDSTLSGASSSLNTPSLAVTGQVYSGAMVWTGASGGSFATGANWHDSANANVHAAPGLDPGFTAVDSATFGATSGSVIVNLNGATPSLHAITFDGSGSYTLALGGGGGITLAGANPTITAIGSQEISTPIAGSNGLTKAGAGTLTLSTVNSYTGDTQVTGGTLKLGNHTANTALANGSAVTIAGGAKLDLDFPTGAADSDTIQKLYLGTPAVQVAAGTYDINTPTYGIYFAGTGSLTVTSGPSASTPFESWAAANGLDGTAGKEKGPGDDPDHDGNNNLAEFAFDGVPLDGSKNAKTFSVIADTNADAKNELLLTIAVRKNAPAFTGSPLTSTVDGITYTIEGSTDLGAFTTAVSVVAPPVTTGLPALNDPANCEYRSFSLTGSNGLPNKGFLRARATQ